MHRIHFALLLGLSLTSFTRPHQILQMSYKLLTGFLEIVLLLCQRCSNPLCQPDMKQIMFEK